MADLFFAMPCNDNGFGTFHGSLIAIQKNRIIAVGKDDDLPRIQKRNTERSIAKAKRVYRFIDAMSHLHALAESYVTLNLEPRHNVHLSPDIQIE